MINRPMISRGVIAGRSDANMLCT